jgi:hypothetical protein
LTDAATTKLIMEHAQEGEYGVRVHYWSGLSDVAPISSWVLDAEQARVKYEETIKQLEAQDVVLARVALIQDGLVTDERFIAQTPPSNYQ